MCLYPIVTFLVHKHYSVRHLVLLLRANTIKTLSFLCPQKKLNFMTIYMTIAWVPIALMFRVAIAWERFPLVCWVVSGLPLKLLLLMDQVSAVVQQVSWQQEASHWQCEESNVDLLTRGKSEERSRPFCSICYIKYMYDLFFTAEHCLSFTCLQCTKAQTQQVQF